MEHNSQHSLIERVQQGQAPAIAELYRLYWPAARATAYGVTAEINLAEDAASEALLAAFDSLQSLENSQCFGPWLRTIVIRTAKRLKNRRFKCKKVEQQTTETTTPQPDTNIQQQELAILIHEAVGSLSQIQREAISLYYFEGYSLKESAAFIDIPEGTLKRRLHEAREALRKSAEQIINGVKPMNPERQQILQQLKEASNEGIHSETFFRAARQALRLHPVPNDLLKEIMLKHITAKKKPLSEEKECKIRNHLIKIYSPSKNAKDPNHPVGAVANSIRAALPEFEQWEIDWPKIDISQMLQDFAEGNEKSLYFLRPPGFYECSEGAYINPIRAWLLQDEDGSIYTTSELIQKKETIDEVKALISSGKRLSDTLCLLLKNESLELRTIENILRRLADSVIPTTTINLCYYDDSRYHSAMRLNISNNPVPAAIGGVLTKFPGLHDTIKVGQITIFLEPWASAQSGRTIELTKLTET